MIEIPSELEVRIAQLPHREKLAVSLRHGLYEFDRCHTLKEVGEQIPNLKREGHVSHKRADQILAKAYRRLRFQCGVCEHDLLFALEALTLSNRAHDDRAPTQAH